MTAVTQRIDNFLGGVSRQSDDKKLSNQVKECLNGYPDPTFGLTKRPGFKWINNLGTGTTYDSSKWFFIHRDDDEKYLGVIKPSTIAITANGTSGATNKINLATTTSGSGTGLTVDLTASGGVVTAIKVNTAGVGYANSDTITIASSAAGTGANVTGTLTLGDIDIWNTTDGTACTVNYTGDAQKYLTGIRESYDVLTVQDTTVVTNKLTKVLKQDDPTHTLRTRATLVFTDTAINSTYSVTMNKAADNPNSAHDLTYSVTTTLFESYDSLISKLKTGIQTFGTENTIYKIDVTNSDTNGGYTYETPPLVTISGGSGSNATATAHVEDGSVTKITVTNPGTGYTSDPTITLGAAWNASQQYIIGSEVTNANKVYKATTNAVSGSTAPTHTIGTASDGAVTWEYKGVQATASPARVTSTNKITGLTVDHYGASIEIERVVSGVKTAFTISAKGGPANNKLAVFQDQVDNVAELPYHSFHDHVVKIINTASDNDTYFAKFVADDGVSGDGYWLETKDPAASPGLNAASMPHELINTEKNIFSFKQIGWIARLVGDDTTNSHPSFIDQKIQQAFFHKNRLGFLSSDNVSMSQSGQFYNFYHTSAQTVTDADPVDLSASTIRPASLHGIIPTAQGLVLFSKNQQFLMKSSTGILTPASTTISTISSYEMDKQVDPVDMGNQVNFINKTPSYTRVFGMVTRGQEENPQVLDIGRVVNEWIPATIDTFIASPQNQFLAMSGQSSNKIYLYRTYNDGERNLLESWFNWDLPGNVQCIFVDEDDMYTVTKQSSQFTLSKCSLSQSPEDAIIVNNKGQRVNPCMDLFTEARTVSGGDKVGYDSTNEFSKCYIPFANVPTLTPVIVIKGTTQAGSFVESGFTITPTVITDDGDPYFKVPGKDLTSVEDDVMVGWKYNLDVTLPRLYFRNDEAMKRTDFTASLTVSRLKFAVGLSGVMGFKLRTIGSIPGSRSYIADGESTVYNWTEDDLVYIDKNQIKVKRNNIPTSDFTVTGDTEITLNAVSSQTKTLSGNGGITFDLTFTPVDTKKIKVKIGGVLQDSSTYHLVKNFITFDSAPATGTNNILVYSADDILIYTEQWYSLNPISKADTYLADDIALDDLSIFTVPVHQRAENYVLRVFNDSAFPVSLNSMMWEGNYSPRFFRRAN